MAAQLTDPTPTPLPLPTTELVRWGKELFAAQGQITEAALQLVLQAFPTNTVTAEILLKVVVINQIYSTGIFAVQPVAERIQAANIDAPLQVGDPSVVHRLDRLRFTSARGKQIDRSIYSFATKYCALHQPQHYPIYDGLISSQLLAYQKQDSFSPVNFSDSDLRDYFTFKAVVLRFQAHYGLTEVSLRDIDQFLWTLGKGLLLPPSQPSP